MDTLSYDIAITRLKQLICHHEPAIALRAVNTLLAEHHRYHIRTTKPAPPSKASNREPLPMPTPAPQAAARQFPPTEVSAQFASTAPIALTATSEPTAPAAQHPSPNPSPTSSPTPASAPILARADYDAHLADLHARAKAHTAKLEALRDHLAASRNAPNRKDLHAQLKTERESRARCLQEIRTLLHLQLRQQSHTSSTLIQSQAA